MYVSSLKDGEIPRLSCSKERNHEMAQNGNDDNYCPTIEQEQWNRVQLPAPGKQGYVDAPCAATFDISRGRVEVFPPSWARCP